MSDANFPSRLIDLCPNTEVDWMHKHYLRNAISDKLLMKTFPLPVWSAEIKKMLALNIMCQNESKLWIVSTKKRLLMCRSPSQMKSDRFLQGDS